MEYIIKKDNARIYYKIDGEGDPILLVHGFAASHSVFRVSQKILSSDYMVISYDLRGHGRSSWSEERIDMETLSYDLKYLIDKLKLKNVVLVGWSLGGAVIFDYIKQFGCENLKKICLIDTNPKLINDLEWNLGLYHGKYDAEEALKDLSEMSFDWNNFSEGFIKRMSPLLDGENLKIAVNSLSKNNHIYMQQIWESVINKDYRNILSKIHVPTLIITGGESTLFDENVGIYLNNNIKSSKLVVFKEQGHLLVQESPAEFSRTLKDFIESK